MSKLEDLRNGMNVRSSIRCLGYFSTFNLIIAICFGFYAQWKITVEPLFLILFILGLLIFGISSIFYCYFTSERSHGVFHLCLGFLLGFLLGLLCFISSPSKEADLLERVSSYMLIVSMGLRTLWALVARICGCIKHCPVLLTPAEALELTGFALASMTMVASASLSLIVLALAVAMLIVDLRMKSSIAPFNLICFAVVSALFFFKSLKVLINPYALACFLGSLVCEPLLDMYFSGLSVTERWLPFLSKKGLWRRLTLLPLVSIEMTFLILAAFKMGDLDQWYFVIPGCSVSSVFWIICHVVFLVNLWGFHNKLSDCQRVFVTQTIEPGALDRVMASKGMRHYCLVSKRLVLFSLVSTAIVGALSWQVSFEHLIYYV